MFCFACMIAMFRMLFWFCFACLVAFVPMIAFVCCLCRHIVWCLLLLLMINDLLQCYFEIHNSICVASTIYVQGIKRLLFGCLRSHSHRKSKSLSKNQMQNRYVIDIEIYEKPGLHCWLVLCPICGRPLLGFCFCWFWRGCCLSDWATQKRCYRNFT